MMRTIPHRQILFMAGFLIACGTDSRDETGSVDPCTDCVELVGVSSLSFGDAPTLPSPSGILAVHPQSGEMAYVDRMVPYEILIFDSKGSFQAALGGEGDGPGEYRRITGMAFDSGGGLWVFSRGGRRADLYGKGFAWARSFQLGEPVEKVAALSDGRFVVVTFSDHGTAVKLMSGDGSFIETGVDVPSDSPPSLVSIASDRNQRFWVVLPHQYRFIDAEIDNGVETLPVSEPPWFSEGYSEEVRAELSSLMDTQGATVLAIQYDADLEALWVYSGVPSAELEVGVVRETLESQDPGAMERLPALLVDHVIECIRLSDAASIASGRFDYIPIALDSPVQYRVRGDTLVEVVRAEIKD